jgi:hypothetical protein
MREPEYIIYKPYDSDEFKAAQKIEIKAEEFPKDLTCTMNNCYINMDLLHKITGV